MTGAMDESLTWIDPGRIPSSFSSLNFLDGHSHNGSGTELRLNRVSECVLGTFSLLPSISELQAMDVVAPMVEPKAIHSWS